MDRGEVTRLLCEIKAGNREAMPKLVELVYPELRRLAGHYMRRERPDHTLQRTALLNEAYLKLAGDNDADWQNRAHFLAVAANAMRHVLVDHARNRKAAKRGGGQVKLQLDDALLFAPEKSREILEIETALAEYEQEDPVKARVVELKFFGGCSNEQIADVMNVAPRKVKRYWNAAKKRLEKKIADRNGSATGPLRT